MSAPAAILEQNTRDMIEAGQPTSTATADQVQALREAFAVTRDALKEMAGNRAAWRATQ